MKKNIFKIGLIGIAAAFGMGAVIVFAQVPPSSGTITPPMPPSSGALTSSAFPLVPSSSSPNVSGWAYSDMPDGSNQAIISSNHSGGQGMGWISMSPTTGSSYGVTIDSSGNFSGYGWSDPKDVPDKADNGGWINFDPTGPYPSGPGTTSAPAHVDLTTGIVTGWARDCAVFASGCSGALNPSSINGGWDGWISLSGTGYGISINSSGIFSGYAWGSDVLGWIDFSEANLATTNGTGTDGGVCGSSNGQVFSSAPTANLCANGTASTVTASGSVWIWTCTGTGIGTPASCSTITTSSPNPPNPGSTTYACTDPSAVNYNTAANQSAIQQGGTSDPALCDQACTDVPNVSAGGIIPSGADAGEIAISGTCSTPPGPGGGGTGTGSILPIYKEK